MLSSTTGARWERGVLAMREPVTKISSDTAWAPGSSAAAAWASGTGDSLSGSSPSAFCSPCWSCFLPSSCF